MITTQTDWTDYQADYLNAPTGWSSRQPQVLAQQCQWLSDYVKTRQHILVVDDLNGPRTELCRDLKRAGFLVSTAAGGSEALDILETEAVPHLIIADVMTPAMDGFTFAERVQEQSNIPIVFLSAIADGDIKAEAITRFAEDYVTIPFAFPVLAARIRRILR